MSGLLDSHPDDENPFTAPPPGPLGPPSDSRSDAELEEIRRRHLGSENDVRLMGALSIMVGMILLLIVVMSLRFFYEAGRAREREPRGIAILAFVGSVGTVCLLGGMGLRRYSSQARGVMLGVVSAISASMAIASLFSGEVAGIALACVILFAGGMYIHPLVNAGARAVFAPEYREVVARTPQIKAKFGPLWIGMMLGLIALGLTLLFVLARYED